MSAIPDYRDIVDLMKKGATLEAQEKIMELRVATLALQEENLRLREQLRAFEQKASLEWDGLVYWLKPSAGKTEKEGSFCQKCQDSTGKLSRLHRSESMGGSRTWYCTVCGQTFYIN